MSVLCGGWELNLDALEEQPVLSTTEPSLQLLLDQALILYLAAQVKWFLSCLPLPLHYLNSSVTLTVEEVHSFLRLLEILSS